jgi:hypothetical protein
MGHHDASLIDKVKNAIGMGEDDGDQDSEDATATTARIEGADDRADGWAGIPEALYDDTASAESDEVVGNEANPGPIGSAQYDERTPPEDLGGTDDDVEGAVDGTREDVAATEYGGAYGEDDTPMPASAAWDRGEAPIGEASFNAEEDTVDPERRETGI